MDLYNKYRPDDFDKMLGNKDTIDLLNEYCNKSINDKPHSFLFYGEHGCGKTTLARILANKFDCEITKLNNSNNRGIDTIREVIYEGSQFRNLLSEKKNKAYILDECHQLPKLSQDSLLEILEEPPEYVYFFLCTTDPQKLLSTIKSRCKQIKVEKIRNGELYPYLMEIAKKENVIINKKVARVIAETSEGHVRDALSILEKVIQFKDEEKQIKIAKEKIQNEKNIIDLCRLLLDNENFNDNIKDVLISLQNENPENIKKVILNYMQKVLLGKTNQIKKAAIIIDHLREYYYDYAALCVDIYKIFL